MNNRKIVRNRVVAVVLFLLFTVVMWWPMLRMEEHPLDILEEYLFTLGGCLIVGGIGGLILALIIKICGAFVRFVVWHVGSNWLVEDIEAGSKYAGGYLLCACLTLCQLGLIIYFGYSMRFPGLY